MKLPFELALALRYLRPKRTFVSVITLISIIGVTLGVAVLIIVMSVMTGFDRDLRERLLDFNAHLKVTNRNRIVSEYRALRNKVLEHDSVAGVAPFIIGPVLVETQPEEGESPRLYTPWVRGVDPELELSVSSLTSTNSI
ncbi:MAG: ABC transporter permease, partial [Verrucomicrobiota bacterium]|nr:ABC transporter permease [Verrucomicrobiota bacterium]